MIRRKISFYSITFFSPLHEEMRRSKKIRRKNDFLFFDLLKSPLCRTLIYNEMSDQLYLKNTVTNEEILERISNIVRVGKMRLDGHVLPIYPFKVVDKDEERGLYLLHYDSDHIGEINDPRVRRLRGTLVDINAGIVVRETHGYQPTTTLESEFGIQPDVHGNVSLVDDDKNRHTFNVNDPTLSYIPYFQGTLIFVTRSYGATDYGTHRRIDSSRSWWGTSVPFKDIFLKFGGPEDDELFDGTKMHSPLCHVFQVIDKSLCMSSKLDLKERDGFLRYLGPITMYQRDEEKSAGGNESRSEEALPLCPYPDEEVDWAGEGPWFDVKENFVAVNPDVGANPFPDPDDDLFTRVHVTNQVSSAIANQILFKGYHPSMDLYEGTDIRLLPGESIICSYRKEGKLTLLQINSPAAAWREKMVENKHNILNRGCILLDSAALPPPGKNDTYSENFPAISFLTPQELHTESVYSRIKPYVMPPPNWRKVREEDLVCPECDDTSKNAKGGKGNKKVASMSRKPSDMVMLRSVNIVICYAFALPLHLQEEALLLTININKERNSVIDYMIEKEKDIVNDTLFQRSADGRFTLWDSKVNKSLKRMKIILSQAHDYNTDRKRDASYKNHFRESIATILKREYGGSLYHIMMFVRKQRTASKTIHPKQSNAVAAASFAAAAASSAASS
jgi:hypothetical protein